MTYQARETTVHAGAPVELYRFHRRAECWPYTSADQPITLNAQTYAPVAISRGELEQGDEQSATTLEVHAYRGLAVAEQFVAGNPPTPVELEVIRLHRGDAEPVQVFRGEVANCRFSGGEATLRCVSTQGALERQVPRPLYQRVCNHALYDPGCGLDPAAWMTPGVVSAVNGVQITVPEAAALGADYLRAGFLRVTGGDARAFITKHLAGGALLLLNPLAELQVGTAVQLYAGCDRLVDTCQTKFNNLPNFFGFPFMPERNPFTQLEE